MHGKTYRIYRIILFLVIAAIFYLPQIALAQGETPYDLVNTINELRASLGLSPYQIDPTIMAYAQEHSDYQAEIQTSTHRHRDGSLSTDIGLKENVAAGDEGVVTVAVVVYEIWVDWGHWRTMTGFSTGEIGAGMAISDNGQVYYTINVRPGDESTDITNQPDTAESLVSLITCTPAADGSIIHTVGYGQTLWGIAQVYGVSINEIRKLNGLADDATFLIPGQKLIIQTADHGTYIPLGTNSSITTPTLTITSKPFQMADTGAITPLQSSTVNPTDEVINSKTRNKMASLVVLLSVGFCALIVVIYFGFVKPNLPSKK